MQETAAQRQREEARQKEEELKNDPAGRLSQWGAVGRLGGARATPNWRNAGPLV